MFSALLDWVETGVAPGDITRTSRVTTVSYPIWVCPQKASWNGTIIKGGVQLYLPVKMMASWFKGLVRTG